MRKWIAVALILWTLPKLYAQENTVEASFDHNYLDLSVEADTILIKKADFTHCRYDCIFPNVKELKKGNLYPMLGGADANLFHFVLKGEAYLFTFGEEDANRISIGKSKVFTDQTQYCFDLYLMRPNLSSADTLFHKTICLQKISKEENEFRYHHEKFYGQKFSENTDYKKIFNDVIPLPISLDRFLFVYQAFYSGNLAKFSMPEGVILNETHYFVMEGEDAFDFRGNVENNIFTIGMGPIVFNPDIKEKYQFSLHLYERGKNGQPDQMVTKKNIEILIVGEGGC